MGGEGRGGEGRGGAELSETLQQSHPAFLKSSCI